jgi:hypothetical protein
MGRDKPSYDDMSKDLIGRIDAVISPEADLRRLSQV